MHRNGTCRPASTAIKDWVIWFGLTVEYRYGDLIWLRAAVTTQQLVRIAGHHAQTIEKYSPFNSEGSNQIREVLPLHDADILQAGN